MNYNYISYISIKTQIEFSHSHISTERNKWWSPQQGDLDILDLGYTAIPANQFGLRRIP